MGGGGKIPDAWDDDWVDKADSSVASEPSPKPAKLSKAERRARQAEFNRQLWEDAERPSNNFFLNAQAEIPLKAEFKPAVKVLSRKPPAATTASQDSVDGISQLAIDDEEDDDNDEENGGFKKNATTFQERQLKAQKEREEKLRKYEEARQRLFGPDGTSSAKSSTRSSPKPKADGDEKSQTRSRAGREVRPTSSGSGAARQLFDPNYNVKPDSYVSQKKNKTPVSSGRSTPSEQQPIRNSRGPDGSGRGGFGFMPRGGRVT
ncbi:MAG: hypothetical protein LQ342_001665 [Letrouitia transgressa]|nr:MAG: hypothetical protein LQ342_001665 [Letrouitia transgressa]